MKILNNDIACNLNWILNIKFENSIQINSIWFNSNSIQFNLIQFKFNSIQFDSIQIQFNSIQIQFDSIQIQFNSIQIQIQVNSYLNSQLNWVCEIQLKQKRVTINWHKKSIEILVVISHHSWLCCWRITTLKRHKWKKDIFPCFKAVSTWNCWVEHHMKHYAKSPLFYTFLQYLGFSWI